jgi:hypothetical protein
MKYIGICGAFGSGKSTLGKLIKNENILIRHFADALKEEVAEKFPELKNEIGWTGDDWSGLKTPRGRHTLQIHGTEMRLKDADYWVKKFHANIPANISTVVVPDCRYVNELNLCALNGSVVWVQNIEADQRYKKGLLSDAPECCHPSEMEWRAWVLCNQTSVIQVYNSGDSLLAFEENIRFKLGFLLKGE